MKKYEIDCWELTTLSGDGVRDEHVAFIASKSEADKYAKKHSIGWPVSVTRYRKTIVVWDSEEELEYNSPLSIKKRALNKIKTLELSEEELRILGIAL